MHRTASAMLGLALAVLFVATAPALAKNSRTINVAFPASLGNTQIAAGEYQMSWESHSPTTTVTFKRGNRVVGAAEGKLVDRDTKYSRDSVVFGAASGGSYTITEIRLGGTKQAIVFHE